MNDPNNKEDYRTIRKDLKNYYQTVRSILTNKLSPEEMNKFQSNFDEFDSLLSRLETGLIYICLFGKTSVGKSAIANSLIGESLAEVDVTHDSTVKEGYYTKPPWMIVDVPGILGKKVNSNLAIEEAKKGHGHIFVLDGEPFEEELELFSLVHEATPNTIKIVYVNKYDVLKSANTTDEIECICSKISEKMKDFIKSKDDIIYGSALLKEGDIKIRQEIKPLEDKLYNDVGSLGQLVNIMDPSKRASSISEIIKNNVIKKRKSIAREVVHYFALGTAVGGVIPFNSLIVSPGIIVTMYIALSKILNYVSPVASDLHNNPRSVAKLIMETGKEVLYYQFVGVFVADAVVSTVGLTFGPFAWVVGKVIETVGLAYYKYNRTAIIGEIMIEYIYNDYSWGTEGYEDLIKRCKKQVEKYYLFKGKGKSK